MEIIPTSYRERSIWAQLLTTVVIFGGYFALTLSYSMWLKHEPVLDLGAVAAGFVLRSVAGGVAVGVPISPWFLIVAGAGSLARSSQWNEARRSLMLARAASRARCSASIRSMCAMAGERASAQCRYIRRGTQFQRMAVERQSAGSKREQAIQVKVIAQCHTARAGIDGKIVQRITHYRKTQRCEQPACSVYYEV